jgi:replicative DNA helicase
VITEPRNGTGPLGPPHNHDAELSVIGAILLSDTVLPALILDEHLTPEDFYRDAHARIYQAILHLHSTGDPVDHVTVKERLRQVGDLDRVGGEGAVDMLAGSVPNLSNVRQYARIIRDNSILRNLLAATQDIQTRVYQRDTSTRDLIDRAETAILRVSDQGRKQPFRPVGDILHESLEALEQLTRGETTLTGLTSGFADIDLITGGFQPGNLIILAARPSMGKSALMANFAENAALSQDRAVALFSLEMSQQELSDRLFVL